MGCWFWYRCTVEIVKLKKKKKKERCVGFLRIGELGGGMALFFYWVVWIYAG